MEGNIRSPWPEWKIGKVIGRGGFAMVYEMERVGAAGWEKAAVKVIRVPEEEEITKLHKEGQTAADIQDYCGKCLRAVEAEYEIMRSLRTHPNIVHCDAFGKVPRPDGIGWDVFIRMELLTPLTETLQGDLYDEERVIRVGTDICSALVFCGQKNIIHRDIKPQNIFVDSTGVYKLGDFGIAKISEKTASGTMTGTMEYMAPEIAKNHSYGARVDIYSLGLVLYWMMNGKRLPFLPADGKIPTAEQRREAYARRLNEEAFSAPANGSGWLRTVVMKACQYRAAGRFGDAKEMLEAIRARKAIAATVDTGKRSGEDGFVTLGGSSLTLSSGNRHRKGGNGQNSQRGQVIQQVPIPPQELDVYHTLYFGPKDYPGGTVQSIPVDGENRQVSLPFDVKNGDKRIYYGLGRRDPATGKAGNLYVTVFIAEEKAKGPSVWKILLPVLGAVAAVIFLVFCVVKNFDLGGGNRGGGGSGPVVRETTPVVTPNAGASNTHSHSWQDATCTSPMTCSICGEVSGTARGHSWQEATVYAPRTCRNCGITEGTALDPFSVLQVGDVFEFGKYGGIPIQWKVLERQSDKLLVISLYGQDRVPYDDQDSSIKSPSAVSWKDSYMRSWLNGQFYDAAFSTSEKSRIVAVSADGINDKVFLLSVGQLGTYFPTENSRRCSATVFAEQNGAYNDNGCWWWVRSNESASQVASVNSDGSMDFQTRVNAPKGTARPCIWISFD